MLLPEIIDPKYAEEIALEIYQSYISRISLGSIGVPDVSSF